MPEAPPLRVQSLIPIDIGRSDMRFGVDPASITVGTDRVVRFEHDWYTPIERPIEVVAGVAEAAPTISVDFEKLKTPLLPGKTKPELGEP